MNEFILVDCMMENISQFSMNRSDDSNETQKQIGRILPQGKKSIIKKTTQALVYTKFLRILKQEKLSIDLFQKIEFFMIPADVEQKIAQNYREQKEKNCSHNGFSFVDFELAMIAQEYTLPLVSFDKHILFNLHSLLSYDASWPTDILRKKTKSLVLLDTNMILSLTDPKHFQRENIKNMLEMDNITFLVPEKVIQEFENVSNYKILSGKLKKKKNKSDFDEEEQDNYIHHSKNNHHDYNRKKYRCY